MRHDSIKKEKASIKWYASIAKLSCSMYERLGQSFQGIGMKSTHLMLLAAYFTFAFPAFAQNYIIEDIRIPEARRRTAGA